MKLSLALAVVCLALAIVFSLAPQDVPVAPVAPALPYSASVAAQPQDEEPAFVLEPRLGPVPDEVPVEVVETSSDIVLEGRVMPNTGTQPQVHLVLESDTGELLDTEADPQSGEFSVVVTPGTWRIVARADGFLPTSEEGLAVATGESLGDIVMTLERSERITGSVRFEEEPVSGVQVAAMGEGFVRTATTDELGSFVIDGLPKGMFTVRSHSGGNGGDERRVPSGSTVHLSLGHREKVRGRVVDARGLPVEGIAVYSDYTPIEVHDSDPLPRGPEVSFGFGMHGCAPSPSCYQADITDASGRFEVDAAPGELLTLGARFGDRTALANDVVPGTDALVTLELKEGPRLRLVDAQGTPLLDTEVTNLVLPRFFGTPKSDADGWVVLPPYGIDASATQWTLPGESGTLEPRPVIKLDTIIY